MTQKLRFFICTVGLGLIAQASFLCAAESTRIEEREFDFNYVTRTQVFNEKSKDITNPVSWLPLQFLSPEGSRVKEGELIAEFDASSAVRRLRFYEFDKAIVDIELNRKLTEIDNQELVLLETLDSLEDNLAIRKAELERYKKLPNEDDILIGEGRLLVAQLNFDAAQKAVDKANDRFSRGMISQAEVEKAEADFAAEKARYDFAKDELSLAKLPASSTTLERIGNEIDNLTLEIAKVKNELKEQQEIATLQRVGAQANKTRIDGRIAEQQEDIEKTSVHSPIDGSLIYNKMRGDRAGLGKRFWAGFNFLRIPDLSSLAMSALVPEIYRRYFEEGDSVDIHLNGAGQKLITGKVHSIGKLAFDMSESGEKRWGQQVQTSGIKVHDVVIHFDSMPEGLFLGQQGFARIYAQQKTKRWAVPLKYLFVEEGNNYLNVEGEAIEVNGIPYGGYFYLENDELANRTVLLNSVKEKEVKVEKKEKVEASKTRNLAVSGELKPVSSVGVIVQRIGNFEGQIKWLIPEDSLVQTGDIVAKLESSELADRLKELTTERDNAQSSFEEQVKRIELTEREEAFKLEKAKNLLEIAEGNMKSALEGVDLDGLIKASLDQKQAQLRLDELVLKLEKQEAKEQPTLSPWELKKLKRDIERQKLRLERAVIEYNRISGGLNPVGRSDAELDYLQKKIDVDIMQRSIEYEKLRAKLALEKNELSLQNHERRVNRHKQFQKNLVMTAPADGIVRYSKIWNGEAIAKARIGINVRRERKVLEIPDQSSMYLEIQLPEHYYPAVKEGMQVEVEIPYLDSIKLKGTVSQIELLFTNKNQGEQQVGLYSSQEPLGEIVFTLRVSVESSSDIKLKPGAVGIVHFPIAL